MLCKNSKVSKNMQWLVLNVLLICIKYCQSPSGRVSSLNENMSHISMPHLLNKYAHVVQAILLADVLPSLIVKLTAPFYIHLLSYRSEQHYTSVLPHCSWWGTDCDVVSLRSSLSSSLYKHVFLFCYKASSLCCCTCCDVLCDCCSLLVVIEEKKANNNNNNNHDDIYSAVIMSRSLREFTRFIWWM